MENKGIRLKEALKFYSQTDKEALRTQRKGLGLTQQATADRAGISIQAYQELESGQRNIRSASFQIACSVIRALEMNIYEFFNGNYCQAPLKE